MRQMQRRLRALEQVRRQALGLRIFKQSQTDPTLFFDEQGQAAGESEINALSAAGWLVIRVVYKSQPGAERATRLR